MDSTEARVKGRAEDSTESIAEGMALMSDTCCSRQQSWNLAEIRHRVLAVKTNAPCVFVLVLCVSAVAQQPRTRVSVEEAKKLVLAALPSSAKQLPKFSLEGGQVPDSAGFYVFMAYWAGAPKGSTVIGHYAVDASTADVWNNVMACEELSTPALRELQVRVRSRIGLFDAEYRKRKRRCPLEMERN